MPRDYKVFLEDMRDAIVKIRRYTSGLELKAFADDEKTVDAVVRNLEVLGEAAKSVPEDVRSRHTQIDWRRVTDLRNILIHQYFAVDVEIIWDIVQNKLPDLERQVRQMLAE
jgi:uncharacterized protein with HEPN domain